MQEDEVMEFVSSNLEQQQEEESMAVYSLPESKVEDEVVSLDSKQEDDNMDLSEDVNGVENPNPNQNQNQNQNSNQNQVVKEDQDQDQDRRSITKFTWRIEEFSRINDKVYSDVFFSSGDYAWRVLVFPRGNGHGNYLSMFLDTADDRRVRCVKFKLSVVDQLSGVHTVSKGAEHRFTGADYGFAQFMSFWDLREADKGYVVEDTCVIEAEIAVSKMVDFGNYDSKMETGYVGLRNQGATCYMNSLLQMLYHIPCFRKDVYRMLTNESEGMPLALLKLFYKLQYGRYTAVTDALTKSFGWEDKEKFTQHDVQELNRVLCEKLEEKMKGTKVEGTIQNLFEGHHMNYIECIDVDYKSTRKESFYDIQLDVKGCRDVYASFDKYVEVERMEGDNKYHAEQHGLQDAKKGISFVDFPPVLQLQLKRFEYDCAKGELVKINDRYEFPLTLDLDRDNWKYLSPDADKEVRNLYTLHSVLVHRGGVNGGHYYAFIRPSLLDQWFKFDDERVTKEEEKMAVQENYGGEDYFKFTRDASAYMLVYVRGSEKDKIICNVDEEDIDKDLLMGLKKEHEEQEHEEKERAEAHLYTTVMVARDQDLVEQIGRGIFFDLFDPENVPRFRVKKEISFKMFQEVVANKFSVPVEAQRFWFWEKMCDEDYPTCRQVTPYHEQLTIGKLKNKNLFLEMEPGLCLLSNPLPEKTEDDILLFCKLYDPKTEQVKYVGRLFVKDTGRPTEVLSKLNKMAGFADDVEIDLYVESKSEREGISCGRIDKNKSFSDLEDGSIIWLQRSSIADKTGEEFQHPDVPSFFEYLLNLRYVYFRNLDKPNVDQFCLQMPKTFSYDDVVESVARRLGVQDPTKIRLRSPSNNFQHPDSCAIKYRAPVQLSDMLRSYNTLYYEILDIPLPELEKLISLDVIFHPHNRSGEHDEIHSIRVMKESKVSDVLDELKTKVVLAHPNSELRLLGMRGLLIRKVFSSTDNIDCVGVDLYDLRADEIPEDETHLGPNDQLIRVYHIAKHRDPGDSFMLVLREGETLSEVKSRIQNKLKVEDEAFSKWKFACCLYRNHHYLEDLDDVSRFCAEVVSSSPFYAEMGYGRVPRYHRQMDSPWMEQKKYFKRGQKYHQEEDKYHEIEDLYLAVESPDDETVGNQKNANRCDKSVKICN